MKRTLLTAALIVASTAFAGSAFAEYVYPPENDNATTSSHSTAHRDRSSTFNSSGGVFAGTSRSGSGASALNNDALYSRP